MPDEKSSLQGVNPKQQESPRERCLRLNREGRMGRDAIDFPRAWQLAGMKELAEYALFRGYRHFNSWDFYCLLRELAVAESAVEKKGKNLQQLFDSGKFQRYLTKILNLCNKLFTERIAQLESDGKLESFGPEDLEISPLIESVDKLTKVFQIEMDSDSYHPEYLETFLRDCINEIVPAPGILIRKVHSFQNFWYDALFLSPWKASETESIFLCLQSVRTCFVKEKSHFGTQTDRPIRV